MIAEDSDSIPRVPRFDLVAHVHLHAVQAAPLEQDRPDVVEPPVHGVASVPDRLQVDSRGEEVFMVLQQLGAFVGIDEAGAWIGGGLGGDQPHHAGRDDPPLVVRPYVREASSADVPPRSTFAAWQFTVAWQLEGTTAGVVFGDVHGEGKGADFVYRIGHSWSSPWWVVVGSGSRSRLSQTAIQSSCRPHLGKRW